MSHNLLYYIYILADRTDRLYTGLTQDLRTRLKYHNAGECKHTSESGPWHIEIAISFRSRDKTAAFEKYLKTGSGRAFAKKHF